MFKPSSHDDDDDEGSPSVNSSTSPDDRCFVVVESLCLSAALELSDGNFWECCSMLLFLSCSLLLSLDVFSLVAATEKPNRNESAAIKLEKNNNRLIKTTERQRFRLATTIIVEWMAIKQDITMSLLLSTKEWWSKARKMISVLLSLSSTQESKNGTEHEWKEYQTLTGTDYFAVLNLFVLRNYHIIHVNM